MTKHAVQEKGRWLPGTLMSVFAGDAPHEDWVCDGDRDVREFIRSTASLPLFEEAVDDLGKPLVGLHPDFDEPLPAGVHVFHRGNLNAHVLLDKIIRQARELREVAHA